MKTINTTLCCIVNRETSEILMVVSKRGFGKDKHNFPGGKSNDGETFVDCAARETIEETGITPLNLKHIGTLEFVWPKENQLVYNEVYYTEQFLGELKEDSEECLPLWQDIKELPFDKMWGSDKVWVPEMLKGNNFHFEFIHKYKEEKTPAYRVIPQDRGR